MEVESCPFEIGRLGSPSFCEQPSLPLPIIPPFFGCLFSTSVVTVTPHVTIPAGAEQVGSDCGHMAARSTLLHHHLWGLAVSSCPHVGTGCVRAPATVPVSFKCEKTLGIYQHSAHRCLFTGVTSFPNKSSRIFQGPFIRLKQQVQKKRVPAFPPNCFKNKCLSHRMGSV